MVQQIPRFDQTKKELENLTDTRISISEDRRVMGLGDIYFDILGYATDDVNHIGSRIKITFSGDGQLYCELLYTFVRSAAENIAIIDWMKVSEGVQNNGIGRTLRGEAVSSLEKNYTIYSKVVNDNLTSVVKDQGFERIDEDSLDSWFVRNPI